MRKFSIQENLRIPGTNILLEKGDKIFVEDVTKKIWTEDSLADALGCNYLNQDNLPLNNDLGMLVYNGETKDSFVLVDEETGRIKYEGLYEDIVSALWEKGVATIKFKNSTVAISKENGSLDIKEINK